jgi:SNF2 family DNA or RNA helicase
LGYQNLNDLVWRLSHVAILLKKSDVLDLPPALHETRYVTLSAKSQKTYNDLKDEMITELEAIEVRRDEYRELKRQLKDLDEESKEFQRIADRMEALEAEGPVTITAEHVFTRIQKLGQITSGFIYPDPTEINEKTLKPIRPPAIRLGHEKLDVLMELMEARAGEPTVIVTQMDEEEKIISEAIRKKYGFIPKVLNGAVQGAEARHQMIAEAANDPCFIVKQKVGARGVDMRWADTIIFYSHNYDTEFYEQMLARNHRGGQTKPVTYIHILAKDTIDVKVMKSLEADLNLARTIEHGWRELFAA